MLGKLWTVAVVAGVLALLAPAAYAQPAPAAKPMTMAKPMAHKASHHKMSCYDYAYQSKAMQDCLAKGSGKPMAKKMAKKKTAS